VLAQEELHTLQTKGEDTHELQTHLSDLEVQRDELNEHLKSISHHDVNLDADTQTDNVAVDGENADINVDTDSNTQQEQTVILEHEEATTDQDQENVVVDNEPQMPSLDNVSEQLEIAKTTTTTEVPKEHVEVAATLLADVTDIKNDHIIKAVDNQEPKEHVQNPDAPTQDTSASDNQDQQDTSADALHVEHADYVPDAHNQMPSDEDHNDGTGLTS
jgi:hypothetical protein